MASIRETFREHPMIPLGILVIAPIILALVASLIENKITRANPTQTSTPRIALVSGTPNVLSSLTPTPSATPQSDCIFFPIMGPDGLLAGGGLNCP